MSEPAPGSPEDQALWLARAQETVREHHDGATQPRQGGSSRPRGRDRGRRATGRPLTTYGTVLASPIDMERYARSGPATGWTEASQDTVDWLLAERERTVVLRSPDGKTTMRVRRDTDEHRTYLEDGWR